MKLYIVRHGESKANIQNIIYCGTSEFSLSEKGKSQAEKLGQFLKDSSVDTIYSSPQGRALNTAKIIAKTIPYTKRIYTNSRLKEVNFGVFEGMTADQVKQNFADIYETRKKDKYNYILPEGESYKQAYERVSSFLKELIDQNMHKDETILIVSHGTLIKLMLLFLSKRTLEEIEQNYFNNTSFFEYEINKAGEIKELVFNSSEHLN